MNDMKSKYISGRYRYLVFRRLTIKLSGHYSPINRDVITIKWVVFEAFRMFTHQQR